MPELDSKPGERGRPSAKRWGSGLWALDQVLAFGLLALLGVATALAVAPGFFAQRIPYTDADLGSIATTTLKAQRDYDLPDEETTRQLRAEAVDRVRAVYVHDAGAIDTILFRIRDGFRFAREVLKGGEPSSAGEARARLDAMRDEIEGRLGARLEDAEFAALGRAGFSERVEQGVVALVAGVMREMVVGDREELAQHRLRGIAIRRVVGSQVVEEVLSEVEGIRDLATVRAQLEATVPELADQGEEVREAAANLARRSIRSNLQHDPELTRKRKEDAAAAVKPVAIQLEKGETIIADGERIESRHLMILEGIRAQSRLGDLAQSRAGGALLALLLGVSLMTFVRTGFPRHRFRRKDLAFLVGLVVGKLLLFGFWGEIAALLEEWVPAIPGDLWTYAFPFAAAAMLLRMLVGAEAALLCAVGFAVLVGAASDGSYGLALVVLVGSLVAASRVARARNRGALFRAGFWGGGVQLGVVICLALFDGSVGSWETLASALAAFAGGALLTPLVVVALLPAAEAIFGYLSNLKLVELASLNHPALKELIVQAPGTYHHSIIVGTLVEAAAKEIGANALLAKVCAYYHDLGKGQDPLYFAENQRGANPHDDLSPEESARIVISHVALGMEIARKHKLPRQVVAAIPEHHGTRVEGFFYHQALKAQEGKKKSEPVDSEAFRYRGPKPQSRETALVMLANSVEAASRSLADPSPEALRELVGKVIQGIFAEGQLDECPLTVQDLSRVADSFRATLEGIYHVRPAPPAPVEASPAAPARPTKGLVVRLRRGE